MLKPFKMCSKCPPWALTQAERRRRHWLMAATTIDWSSFLQVCNMSLLRPRSGYTGSTAYGREMSTPPTLLRSMALLYFTFYNIRRSLHPWIWFSVLSTETSYEGDKAGCHSVAILWCVCCYVMTIYDDATNVTRAIHVTSCVVRQVVVNKQRRRLQTVAWMIAVGRWVSLYTSLPPFRFVKASFKSYNS